MEVETVSGGLILPEEGEIEEIRVELSLGPICFSKIRPCKPLDIPGPHIDNYHTPEVENPYKIFYFTASFCSLSIRLCRLP